MDQSDYLLDVNPNPDHDLKLADWTVKKDVTQNPEPRFYRSLVNARYGDLRKAKADSDFILKLEPGHPSYRALAAYIAVLAGDKTLLQSFYGEAIKDARALSLLGEAAYLSGDVAGAHQWWSLAAKAYPLGASLAYLAGKKHLTRGQRRVAAALLTECTIMAPNSKEAKEAQDLLAKLQAPGS
jgi:predicted Zn-dependent protease